MNGVARSGATRSRRLGFAALLASMFLADLGTAMSIVALPLLLVQEYGFSAEVGIALAIRVLPNVVMGPAAGAILARFDPRRVAIVSSLFLGVPTGLIAFTHAIWQVQVLSLAIGVASMFIGPSRLVLRTRVIEEGDELRGNGFLVAVERVPSLIGPPIVVLLLTISSLRPVFLWQAALTIAAAVMVLGVPGGAGPASSNGAAPATPPHRWQGVRKELVSVYVTNTRRLIRECSNDRFIRGLTLTAFTYVLAVGVGRFVLIELGEGRFGQVTGFYGYLVAAMGIGGVLGGLLAGRLSKLSGAFVYIFGNVAEALIWVLVVLAPNQATALVLMCVAGILESLATAVFFAEVQKRVSDEATGYYFAALIPITDACGFAGTALGAVVTGWSAQAAAFCTATLIALPVVLTARWYITPQVAARVRAESG